METGNGSQLIIAGSVILTSISENIFHKDNSKFRWIHLALVVENSFKVVTPMSTTPLDGETHNKLRSWLGTVESNPSRVMGKRKQYPFQEQQWMWLKKGSAGILPSDRFALWFLAGNWLIVAFDCVEAIKVFVFWWLDKQRSNICFHQQLNIKIPANKVWFIFIFYWQCKLCIRMDW